MLSLTVGSRRDISNTVREGIENKKPCTVYVDMTSLWLYTTV